MLCHSNRCLPNIVEGPEPCLWKDRAEPKNTKTDNCKQREPKTRMLPRQLRNLQDATCVERSICRAYPQSAYTRVAADGAIMDKAVSPVLPKGAPKTKRNCHNLSRTFDIPIDIRSVLEREEVGGQHRRVPDSGPCRSFEVDVSWA